MFESGLLPTEQRAGQGQTVNITPTNHRFVQAVPIDVSDIEAATVFWTSVTGGTFEASFNEDCRESVLRCGTYLVLRQVTEDAPAKQPVHVDIPVANIGDAIDSVRSLGGHKVGKSNCGHPGSVFCLDPDGNDFCLVAA
jgi:predicted enzyme related to lactoylglutathione lyase